MNVLVIITILVQAVKPAKPNVVLAKIPVLIVLSVLTLLGKAPLLVGVKMAIMTTVHQFVNNAHTPVKIVSMLQLLA